MEHLSALQFNSRGLFVLLRMPLCRLLARHLFYHLSTQKKKKKTKKGKKKTDKWENWQIVSARFRKPPIFRSVCFCIAVSLYPVWADVDAIYQVLKQAGEIRGNSTNSPPTPPTAEHPPSGAAPSSARASSHPCSSSTSGKAHYQEFLPILERTSKHLGFFHVQWRITTFVRIARGSSNLISRLPLLNFLDYPLNRWALLLSKTTLFLSFFFFFLDNIWNWDF